MTQIKNPYFNDSFVKAVFKSEISFRSPCIFSSADLLLDKCRIFISLDCVEILSSYLKITNTHFKEVKQTQLLSFSKDVQIESRVFILTHRDSFATKEAISASLSFTIFDNLSTQTVVLSLSLYNFAHSDDKFSILFQNIIIFQLQSGHFECFVNQTSLYFTDYFFYSNNLSF